MNTKMLMMILASGLALAGCEEARSPAEVRQDVAESRAEGYGDVADARAAALKDSVDAETDVTKAVANHDVNEAIGEAREADQVAAEGAEKVRLAQAEADHDVAIQKCAALDGDARKQCRDQANAALEREKDHAGN